MMVQVEGKRVLITAGASGIGKAMAWAFQRQGARVAIGDIDPAGVAEMSRAGFIAHRCDVADRPACEAFVASAVAELGGLDVLINNAGIAGATAPVETYDLAVWQQVMDVNLGGTFSITQLAIPHLRRSPSASVINMSALAGRLGYPHRSAYAASKWGLIGFTKTLAIELGPYGIRVNAILPGPVNGERLQAVLRDRARQSGRSVEEETAKALQNVSIKRFVEPEQVAALAVFLASDAASMVSGQMLPMDGDTQSIA